MHDFNWRLDEKVSPNNSLFDIGSNSSSENELMDFTINFYEDVNPDSANTFISELDKMINKSIYFKIDYDIEMPIIVKLNTPGGYISEGFRMINYMNQSPIPIYTVADGTVASMGIPILLAGSKRFSYRNSYFLIHSLSTSFRGNFNYIKDYMKNIDRMQKELNEYIASRSGNEVKIIEEMMKHEFWFSETEAIEHKMISGVISSDKELFNI